MKLLLNQREPMSKNIEINIQTSTNTYEVLYPKIDLTNNQGTLLPIGSVSGNLSVSRVSGNWDLTKVTNKLAVSNVSEQFYYYTGFRVPDDNLTTWSVTYPSMRPIIAFFNDEIGGHLTDYLSIRVNGTDARAYNSLSDGFGVYFINATGTNKFFTYINPNGATWSQSVRVEMTWNSTKITFKFSAGIGSPSWTTDDICNKNYGWNYKFSVLGIKTNS